MEVELRAKVASDIEKTLSDLGARNVSTHSEHDKYFTFKKDTSKEFIIRIRKKLGKTILTIKGSDKGKHDTAWHEWETVITNPEILEKLLLSNGFEKLVIIKKIRKQYKLGKMEINADNIETLGKFIEVEIHTNNRKSAEQEIEKFMTEKLNIKQKDIIRKGYVNLMISK